MADYTARTLTYEIVGSDGAPLTGAAVTATLQAGGAPLVFGEDLPLIVAGHRVDVAERTTTSDDGLTETGTGVYSAQLIPNRGDLAGTRYLIEQRTPAGDTSFYIDMPDEDVGPGLAVEIADIHEVEALSQAPEATVLQRLFSFLRTALRGSASVDVTPDAAAQTITLTFTGSGVQTNIGDGTITEQKFTTAVQAKINNAVNDVAVSGRDVTGSRTGGGTITGGTISPPSKTEVFEQIKAIFRSGTNTTFRSDDSAETAQVDGQAGGGPSTPLSNADPQAPGTAAPGTSSDASRADHVHPLQSVPQPYNSDPEDLGTAAQGTSDAYARGDHVHQLPDIPQPSNATPLVEGTASAGTAAEYARADHVHPEGGGGGGGNVNQSGIYNFAKSIFKAGYRILLGTDDAKNEITVSVEEVPSGNTLPAKPWHLGQRFDLLMDQTVEQDALAVYLEAESGPTETVWRLGPNLQLRAYGAGHTQAQLRNKVYLLRVGDYNFPPSGTITLTWYRTSGTRQTYTVSRAAVAALVHWHLVSGLDFATAGTTETQFGYLWNLQVGTGPRANPDATVTRGGLIFNGGSVSAGWVPRPEEAAPWARRGQPYPGTNLAAEIMLDGPANGITVVRGGAVDQLGPWTALLDEDGQPFDLAGKQGSVQCTVPMIITSPSSQNIGWDGRGIAKAVVFRGPVFVRDVLAAPAAAGITQGANVDGEDVFNGTTKDATIRLQIGFTVDGSRRPARYRFVKDGDRTDSGYVVGPNGDARIELWRQEPTESTPLSDVAPRAPGTASAGTAAAASREDHVHPAQDVPEPSNAAPLAPAAAAAQGSSARYSRQDHRHPLQAVPQPATSGTPSAPGAASRGTSAAYARADHRHPAQAVPQPSNAAPLAPAASAAQGSSTRYSRQDHVHPEQSVPQPATATPLVEGTGAVGTSARYAREDHVHPAGSGGGGGGTTTLASAFPIVYAAMNAASAINLTNTDWTAWQDVPGASITVTAAQAGSVILDGHVHGVSSSASGGGDRAYVGARVLRTRGTATRVCSRVKDYVRNADNQGGISAVTREGEDDVLCLEEAQTGDVFKLQVRARQQVATTRTFDLSQPVTTGALADQHPGCQLVMGPLGKAGEDAPFRRVLHAGAGGSITVPDTDDHTYNPLTLFVANTALGTIALDVDAVTGGGFVTRAQLRMTAKSKASLAFQSSGGDLSPEAESEFLLSTLRESTVYDSARASNTVFGVYCGDFQVYDGATELGFVSLYIARQTGGLTGFRLLYDHAGTAGASFTATLDLNVSFFPMDARGSADADPVRSAYFNPVRGASDRYSPQDHAHPNTPADNLSVQAAHAAGDICGTARFPGYEPGVGAVRIAGPYTSRPTIATLRAATWGQSITGTVLPNQLYYAAVSDHDFVKARVALDAYLVGIYGSRGTISAYRYLSRDEWEYLGNFPQTFVTGVTTLRDLFEINVGPGPFVAHAGIRVEEAAGYQIRPDRIQGPVRTLIARTPALATTTQAEGVDYAFGSWSLASGAPSGFSTYPNGLVVPNLAPTNLIGIAADLEVGGAVTARGLLNPGPVYPRGAAALTDTAQGIFLVADTAGTAPNTAREVIVQTFHNRNSNGLNGITVKGRGDTLPANTRVAFYAVSIGPLA